MGFNPGFVYKIGETAKLYRKLRVEIPGTIHPSVAPCSCRGAITAVNAHISLFEDETMFVLDALINV